MVNANKLITLSIDLINKLAEEDNASALIRQLLESHYNYIESDDEGLLNNKLNDLEKEREILDKRIEHIKDKLIVIKSKAKEKDVDVEYQKAITLYNNKAKALMNAWRQNQITEEQYWRQVDELKLSKPKRNNN